jgi:hypothetical protein
MLAYSMGEEEACLCGRQEKDFAEGNSLNLLVSCYFSSWVIWGKLLHLYKFTFLSFNEASACLAELS